MMARCDSTQFARESAQAAAAGLPVPPRPLAADALQFWERVIRSKRLNAWTQIDLVGACALCRDLALIETLQEIIDTDGPLIETDRSGPRAHPALDQIDKASRRVIAMARCLQVHALATSGRAEQQPFKNEAARDIDDALDNVHTLIARPRPN